MPSLLFLCCWDPQEVGGGQMLLGTGKPILEPPRLGKETPASAGKMVTCCFLSDPRTHGMGRGIKLSCLSIRLFIPAPSHPSPGPLALSPFLHSSAHPPIDPTSPPACPLCRSSPHLSIRPPVVRPSCCTAHIQCACSGPTLHLREKWGMVPGPKEAVLWKRPS